MPETVYRETRSYARDRDDFDDDDDRHSHSHGPTVRRYKVNTTNFRGPSAPLPPNEYERTERIIERDYGDGVYEDDRRSHFSHSHGPFAHAAGRSSGDLLEVDTSHRVYQLPERPRSAFDAPVRNTTTVTEKVVERERERSPVQEFYDITQRTAVKDDGRKVIYEKTQEVERDVPYSTHERSRTTVEQAADPYWDTRGDRGGGAVVYEKTKELERVPGHMSPRSPRDWERPWERDNVDVRVERRVERRDDGADVMIQTRREERREDAPLRGFERIRRETEYFEPAPPDPAPIIIRQRAPEQRIILQEAPEPAPIVVPYRPQQQQQANEGSVARRDRDLRDDDYYYKHREIEKYDGRRVRDEEYAMYRRGRSRDRYSDGDRSDEDDVIIRRTIIKRERSKSRHERSRSSERPLHHARHLAEGAIAGAGIAALAASNGGRGNYRRSSGAGRKVLAGAALGAIGTEVVKRARSVYNERYGDDHDRAYEGGGRARSRSRPGERYEEEDRYDRRNERRNHGQNEDDDDDRGGDDKNDRTSKIKTGLGLAAAALAVAGAAKYYQSQKIEKEELRRGRSRIPRSSYGYSSDSDSYYSRSRSRSRGGGPGPRSPSGNRGGSGGVAKAAAGTAAVAGLVQHFRNKSRTRSAGGKGSKSRSRSRLRTGAEIVAAGLAGAAGKKIYDKARSKSRERSRSRSPYSSDEEYERRSQRERERSRRRGAAAASPRSRSVSRSRSRSNFPSPPRPQAAVADPELGLVEYGGHAIYPDAPAFSDDNVVDAAEERRQRRAQRLARNRERNRGAGGDYADDLEAERVVVATSVKKDKEVDKRARSRSRFRDMAAGAAAAAAAGIGLKKYEESRKDRKNAESREHSREHSLERTSPTRDQRRIARERARRERDRERRSYEDSITSNEEDPFGDPTPTRPLSPLHASGGAHYGPPPPADVDPELGNTTFVQGFTQHPNLATTNLSGAAPAYPPYNPQDYFNIPPPPPGPPPNSAATPSGLPPPPMGGYQSRPPPNADHVSRHLSSTVTVDRMGEIRAGERDGAPQDIRDGGSGLDGLNHPPKPIHSPDVLVTSSSDSVEMPTPKRSPSPAPAGGSSSRVQWIPLSPQSSQTLLNHRKSRSRDNIDQDDDDTTQQRDMVTADEGNADRAAATSARRQFRKRPRTPDHPNTLVARRPLSAMVEDHSSSSSTEEIEVLPDRFDPNGRPVDGAGPSTRQNKGGWTERHGDFEYRSPRPGGTHVRGSWGVAGTDAAQVERMVQDVSGLLMSAGGEGTPGIVPRGVGGWLGLAGRLLGGVVAPGVLGAATQDGVEREGRGYGGGGSDVSRDERGKGRRRSDDHGYDDEEEDGDIYGKETSVDEPRRRRRRRKRRELD